MVPDIDEESVIFVDSPEQIDKIGGVIITFGEGIIVIFVVPVPVPHSLSTLAEI